jgi:3-dehydroquinate dehydratase II
MSLPVYVLNGPNLNLLGLREPEIYGPATLDDIERQVNERAQKHGLAVEFRQSNHEGVLIDWIQEARTKASAIIFNPGGYSHTSVALLDALKTVACPVIEVHLSNPYRRETFRRHSFVSQAALGVICGFGARGYLLAIDAIASLVTAASLKKTQ